MAHTATGTGLEAPAGDEEPAAPLRGKGGKARKASRPSSAAGSGSGSGPARLHAAGPVPAAQSAPRSLRRALFTPWANPGSRYRCGKST